MNTTKMATLRIASKANQAASIPVLLIANLINNKDPNALITVDFEDAETLQSSGQAVEFIPKTGDLVSGPETVISNLVGPYSRLSVEPSPAQNQREDLVSPSSHNDQLKHLR